MPSPVRLPVYLPHDLESGDRFTYVGIDPGTHGGIAIVHNNLAVTKPTPEHYCDQLIWIYRTLLEFPSPYRVVIEQVQGFIGRKANAGGKEGNTGSSMFTFGQTYGAMLMTLTALRDLAKLDLKYITVPPNTWQRGLKITPRAKTEPRHKFKGRLADLARYYFPQKNITRAVSDALLLAHYSRTKVGWS